MILPKPGTPAFAQFMLRARDSSSLEAQIIKQVNDESANQAQAHVRNMLYSMLEKVPGQLYRDVGRFHSKFGLAPTDSPGHEIPEDLLKFRITFMFEELFEYCQAVGVMPLQRSHEYEIASTYKTGAPFNAEKAMDALIDLAYVLLGTAFLHRFPFNQGWERVQEANMAKVRADGKDDPRSHRGHSADIVKPEGWKAPSFEDILGPTKICSCEGPLRKAVVHGDKLYCEICDGLIESNRTPERNILDTPPDFEGDGDA